MGEYHSNIKDEHWSNTNIMTKHINNLASIYNNTVTEVFDKYNNNNTYSSSNNSNNNIIYTTIVESKIPVSPKLRNKPSPNGGVIYKPKEGERVDVLEKITDRYYRVKVNGYYGYIAKSFIK